MTRVTAIIPTFNRAKLLDECIASILAQSRFVDEIIVVNDGSTDNTLEVLERFRSRVKVLSKPNGGKSSALNLGLEQATGDAIWICDDDDIAHPNGLERLCGALDTAPDAPFAYGHFKPFEDVGGVRRVGPRSDRGRETEEDNFLITTLEQMTAYQFATLARRASYMLTGPFREHLVRSQDFDMLIRLARLGRPVYVPKTIFFQRQHSGQRGSAIASFGSDDAYDKAIVYSGHIIRDLRDDVPIEAYVPQFARAWSNSEAIQSVAFLQRGLICGQRAQWAEAAQDLSTAADLARGRNVAKEEHRLAGRVVRDLKPWPILARDPASIYKLARVRRSGTWGKAIISEMSAALGWFALRLLRERQWRQGARCVMLYLRLAGGGAAIARILRREVIRGQS